MLLWKVEQRNNDQGKKLHLKEEQCDLTSKRGGIYWACGFHWEHRMYKHLLYGVTGLFRSHLKVVSYRVKLLLLNPPTTPPLVSGWWSGVSPHKNNTILSPGSKSRSSSQCSGTVQSQIGFMGSFPGSKFESVSVHSSRLKKNTETFLKKIDT